MAEEARFWIDLEEARLGRWEGKLPGHKSTGHGHEVPVSREGMWLERREIRFHIMTVLHDGRERQVRGGSAWGLAGHPLEMVVVPMSLEARLARQGELGHRD